jgi:hypothetical protein
MPLSEPAQRLRRRVTHPVLFRAWSLFKLPAALFAGVRVRALDEARCVTAVPYGWRSQNPFRSIYFACQAMAAELSTGALVMLAIADAGVPFSMLIVDMRASFGKKAVSIATFTCADGEKVFTAVREARETGEPRVVTMETVGTMADGAEVSRFTFTWSLKARSNKG